MTMVAEIKENFYAFLPKLHTIQDCHTEKKITEVDFYFLILTPFSASVLSYPEAPDQEQSCALW